ncbi:MAG: hypothetical protein WBF51_04045 [Candidatus Dormiibacterota bacterium]
MADNTSDSLTTAEMYDLDAACRMIARAFDCPYLVGSAGIEGRRDYRDVDVRLILSDEEFDKLFPDMAIGRPRWELLCVALGDYLRIRTRLPIDFQIQRQTEANQKHNGKYRNPLGMARNFAGGGDATPEDWKFSGYVPKHDELSGEPSHAH